MLPEQPQIAMRGYLGRDNVRPPVPAPTSARDVMNVKEAAHGKLQQFVDELPAMLGRADEVIELVEVLGSDTNKALQESVSAAALVRSALLEAQRQAVASRDALDRFVIS